MLKSVLRNATDLLQQGIAVPGPGKYRSLIRETIQGLDGAPPAPETREILLDAIIEDDNIHRLVLCNDNFIAIPRRIFDHGIFYPQAEMKVRGLHQLFPGDEISLFLGIRNPVSFLQETLRRAELAGLGQYLGMMDPTEVRWSDVIARIRRAAPQTPLYVWCNEDTPFIWDQLIRLLSGISDESTVAGGYDILSTIMTPEGLEVLADRLRDASGLAPDAQHSVIADVLAHHAIPEAVDESIDVPELDAALIEDMTEGYARDLDIIDRIEGVELILPFR